MFEVLVKNETHWLIRWIDRNKQQHMKWVALTQEGE